MNTTCIILIQLHSGTVTRVTTYYFFKGLGAIRAKIGTTSDVDKIFSKMYLQYVLFINKYS